MCRNSSGCRHPCDGPRYSSRIAGLGGNMGPAAVFALSLIAHRSRWSEAPLLANHARRSGCRGPAARKTSAHEMWGCRNVSIVVFTRFVSAWRNQGGGQGDPDHFWMDRSAPRAIEPRRARNSPTRCRPETPARPHSRRAMSGAMSASRSDVAGRRERPSPNPLDLASSAVGSMASVCRCRH